MKSIVIVLSFFLVLVQDSLGLADQQVDEQVSPAHSKSHGCALRVLDAKKYKSVCVCNSTYCDEFDFKWPTKRGEGLFVQTTKTGLRFYGHNLSKNDQEVAVASISPESSSSIDHASDVIELTVNITSERQSILGFGGAFTDAAGINIQGLPKRLRRRLMESYFGKHGSQYTFGRVVIGGADFSTRAYSLDDRPDGSSDFNLTHWSLAPEDHKYKIPLIKEAKKLVKSYKSSLSLFGSSWSPPAFMKTSHSLVRGHLIETDQVYRSNAQYLVKFYEAYKSEGIDFWGGTVQNEPVASDSRFYNFNSLEMSPEEAIKFVGKYLGPALAASGYTRDNFKLMVNDDNIDALLKQVPTILADADVRKYVAGVAFHWYNDGRVPYNVLSECYDKVKDKVEFFLMTEACIIPGILDKAVDLGSWERGERYANDIIEDLRRHSAGWVDWNLALDQKGRPNWVHGFVDSPVIVNRNRAEFYKQPMYYVLAHFSRFFRPGSVVIDVSVSGLSDDNQLMAVAAHKKDSGHLIVNVLNKSKDSKNLRIRVLGVSRDVIVHGMSMNTVVVKL
uniref:Glucosylceramidase n=1 Tax=Aceria tosichella TaxID=561515 RepID=A0A6G1S6B3_9ACAR